MKLFRWFIIGIFLFTPVFAYSAPSLAARLKGRILLAVEDKGKTYYVAPDGYRYLITRATAQKVFKKLALGISNKNLEQIPIKELAVEPEVLPEPVERIVYVDKYIEKQCASVESYKNEVSDLEKQVKTLKANWDIKEPIVEPTPEPNAYLKNQLNKEYGLKINGFQKQVLDLQIQYDNAEKIVKDNNQKLQAFENWNLVYPNLLKNFKSEIQNKILGLNQTISLLQNELEKKLLELE